MRYIVALAIQSFRYESTARVRQKPCTSRSPSAVTVTEPRVDAELSARDRRTVSLQGKTYKASLKICWGG